MAGTSIVVAVVAIAIATYIYAGSRQPVANALARRFKGLWTAAYHRFYLDEVYQFITHRIIFGHDGIDTVAIAITRDLSIVNRKS